MHGPGGLETSRVSRLSYTPTKVPSLLRSLYVVRTVHTYYEYFHVYEVYDYEHSIIYWLYNILPSKIAESAYRTSIRDLLSVCTSKKKKWRKYVRLRAHISWKFQEDFELGRYDMYENVWQGVVCVP